MKVHRNICTAALAAFIATTGQGAAQVDVDCSAPLTHTDMMYCARMMTDAADGDLNLAYRIAMDAAREMDKHQPDAEPTNAQMMRMAQRKWIPFRDAACAAESTLAHGGRMQPLLELGCLERLTRERAAHLRFYGEVN